MTKHARIRQSDIDRALKSVRRAGGGRVVLDYANGKAEIILGESESAPGLGADDGWDDEDGDGQATAA